jgi:hypothetical protein
LRAARTAAQVPERTLGEICRTRSLRAGSLRSVVGSAPSWLCGAARSSAAAEREARWPTAPTALPCCSCCRAGTLHRSPPPILRAASERRGRGSARPSLHTCFERNLEPAAARRECHVRDTRRRQAADDSSGSRRSLGRCAAQFARRAPRVVGPLDRVAPAAACACARLSERASCVCTLQRWPGRLQQPGTRLAQKVALGMLSARPGRASRLRPPCVSHHGLLPRQRRSGLLYCRRVRYSVAQPSQRRTHRAALLGSELHLVVEKPSAIRGCLRQTLHCRCRKLADDALSTLCPTEARQRAAKMCVLVSWERRPCVRHPPLLSSPSLSGRSAAAGPVRQGSSFA